MLLYIITVSSNNLDGLTKTANSILEQTFRDFEWIVIDGGSSDGSKEYLSKNNKYISYWCSEPDNGIYNAMNKGIMKAKGNYLLFMNSGDFLFNKHVLKKVFSSRHKKKLLCGGQCYYSVVNNSHTYIAWDKAICVTGADLWHVSIYHQATFIHRSYFDKYGLYNEKYKILADWVIFYIGIVLNNEEPEFIPCVICKFESNGISSVPENSAAELERARKKEFPVHITSLYKKELYKATNNYILKSKLSKYLYFKLGKFLFNDNTENQIENLPYLVQQDYKYMTFYKRYHSRFFYLICFYTIRIYAEISFKVRTIIYTINSFI